MTLIKTFTCVSVLFYFVGVGSTYAQVVDSSTPLENVNATTDYEPVFVPELFATSITIDDDDDYPVEPNMQEVEFLKLPEVASVSERVERLVQGIIVDVPPEYDHYGYEIRRYMAGVGHPKIHNDKDEDYLIEQIKNIRKAKVIAQFWRKHLENEISELQAEVNETGVSFATKTAYKQNSITVKTFMISLNAWIDSNEALLMYIFDNPGIFDLYYPEIIFVKPNLRIDYFNLAIKRAQKLKEIREYLPFAMMVY